MDLTDPAVQQELNERWRREHRRMRMPKTVKKGLDTAGPIPQSAEAVKKVLAKVQGETSEVDAPVSKPPVVEPLPVGATKNGDATATRNVSTVARMLLMSGMSNADVFAELQNEFHLPDSRRTYPAWYRAQLTKAGVLDGNLATSTIRTNGMATPNGKTIPVAMTLGEQVAYLAEMTTKLTTEMTELKLRRSGMAAAHKALCVDMGLKTKEQQATSPLLPQLEHLDKQVETVMEKLREVATQHRGMTAALAAYTLATEPKAEKPKAEKPKQKAVRPEKSVTPPAPETPAQTA